MAPVHGPVQGPGAGPRCTALDAVRRGAPQPDPGRGPSVHFGVRSRIRDLGLVRQGFCPHQPSRVTFLGWDRTCLGEAMPTARRLPPNPARSAPALRLTCPCGRLLGGLLVVLLVTLPQGPVQAAEPAPENPFAALVDNLRVGNVARGRGAIVAALEVPPSKQVALTAHVGLAGAPTDILPLPGPAGVWHVRVANKGDVALFIPAGETLVTPTQPSRSTDRPVWIEPGAATFVPVVQRQLQGEPPQGPYFCRGRGLSPVELSQIRNDRWAQRVRARNAGLGVPGARLDDAAAGYTTEAFATVLQRYQAQLDTLVKGPSVVGVLVADHRGIHFAHIVANHTLFKGAWPALRDGLVADAALVESVGGAPRPGDEGQFRSTAIQILRVLDGTPLNRPNFGEGWEYRWVLADPPGIWDGLGLATGPVCLTLHREPVLPAGSPPLPGTEGPPEGNVPGQLEGERRRRPTEFEDRLRDRRRGMPNGPNLPAGPGTNPPRNPGATPPAGPRAPAPTPPSPAPTPPSPSPSPAPAPAPAPGPGPSPGPGVR